MGNVISDLAAGATSGLFSGIGEMFKDIRNAFGGLDPDKKAELETKFIELENQVLQAQSMINLEEAKSDAWWKAGWRPFIGWIGGLGLAIQFLVLPLLALVDVVPKVPLDFSQLINLVIAMLGIGVMRTFEKKSGVN